MYVKRHAVRRGRKRYVYLRLVQAYRDEHGRVRHRVLKTLGREDELKASGQLEQLMGSFAQAGSADGWGASRGRAAAVGVALHRGSWI